MAFHYYPYEDHQTPLFYIEKFEPKLMIYALEAQNFLDVFSNLTVWEIQQKGKGAPNICWYVGFKDRKDPYILNFTITKSDLNIEYRFSQYLPKKIFDILKWQNTSWRRSNLKTYGFNNVIFYINSYIENIKDDFNKGILKKGGQSFAEKMIFSILQEIYPNSFIQPNIRLDTLRSLKGKPLELDIYIEELKLAFEIQGPQHFENIYGDNQDLMENDQHKKQLCKKLGIKLIWLNWEGINSDLLKVDSNTQINIINSLIDLFKDNKYNFIWWKNSSNISKE